MVRTAIFRERRGGRWRGEGRGEGVGLVGPYSEHTVNIQ